MVMMIDGSDGSDGDDINYFEKYVTKKFIVQIVNKLQDSLDMYDKVV